jgi:hypothetical protein
LIFQLVKIIKIIENRFLYLLAKYLKLISFVFLMKQIQDNSRCFVADIILGREKFIENVNAIIPTLVLKILM